MSTPALLRNLMSLKALGALIAFAMSGYHLYTGFVGAPVPEIHYPLHVLFTFAVLYLLHSIADEGKLVGLGRRWYNFILLAITLAATGYLFLYAEHITTRMVMVEPLSTIEIVLGAALILVILEAARRLLGWAIVVIGLVFLGYAFVGSYLPHGLGHRGYSLERLVEYLYLTNEGIFSAPVAVMASYVFHFVLFGSFLVVSGAGTFFTELATALAGRVRGGAAKTAIISSGLMGMISGSSAANVVTTGSFTIPAMKRNGYSKDFAAAVEAVASSGGQITPPIMGAAAFIMAEISGISYVTIIGAAVIPAVLYYAGVYMMVDLEARRLRLEQRAADAPSVVAVLRKRGYLVIPLVVMLYLLIDGWSPTTAAVYAIVSLVTLLALFDAANRRRLHLVCWQAMIDAPKMIAPVTIACAIGGVLLGIITLTGLGLRVSGLILDVASGQLFVTLLLTMIIGVILGMGMPTSGAYIVLAALLAPALVDAGVPVIAAHMFVLFSAAKSSITPPVAIASYAAAALANSDPWRTSLIAFKLGLSVFLIPFMYAYDINLLGHGPIVDVASAFLTALIGIFALSVACVGWAFTALLWWERLVVGGAAVLLLKVGLLTDLVGFALIVITLASVRLRHRRDARASALSADLQSGDNP